jgi:hypothetical protein
MQTSLSVNQPLASLYIFLKKLHTKKQMHKILTVIFANRLGTL